MAPIDINTTQSNTAHLIAHLNKQGATKIVPLPFNPNDLTWSYDINKISFDTYGGRVTQILSVKTGSMSLSGDSGSRFNLLNLYKYIKSLQEWQVQNSKALEFVLPSVSFGDIGSLYVWIRGMNIGWDPTTVTYPYTIQFEIQDDGGYGDIQQVGSGQTGFDELVSLFVNMNLSNGTHGIGFNSYYAGLDQNTSGVVSFNQLSQVTGQG